MCALFISGEHENDLKRSEIAAAQADCTVAGSFHPFLRGVVDVGKGKVEGQRDGGEEECDLLSGQGFAVTAVLLSRGGGSSTGSRAA